MSFNFGLLENIYPNHITNARWKDRLTTFEQVTNYVINLSDYNRVKDIREDWQNKQFKILKI